MTENSGVDGDVYADVVAVDFADIPDASLIMPFCACWRLIAGLLMPIDRQFSR